MRGCKRLISLGLAVLGFLSTASFAQSGSDSPAVAHGGFTVPPSRRPAPIPLTATIIRVPTDGAGRVYAPQAEMRLLDSSPTVDSPTAAARAFAMAKPPRHVTTRRDVNADSSTNWWWGWNYAGWYPWNWYYANYVPSFYYFNNWYWWNNYTTFAYPFFWNDGQYFYYFWWWNWW